MKALDTLAKLLVVAIPQAVQLLKLKKPTACVRIYYFDTTAPCGYLTLRIISEKLRARLLADEGQNALYALWASAEETRDSDIDVPNKRLKNSKKLSEFFAEIYEQLGADKGLRGYRKMLQGVANKLNGKNWSKICPVTDDFVVAAADGSQAFADDYPDLVKSIPPARLKLLRQRGLLGPGQDWDSRPGAKPASASELEQAIKAIEAKAQAMPVPQRVSFWIDEMTKSAAGKACDLERINELEFANSGIEPERRWLYPRSMSYPLGQLTQVGADAVVPLLKLALKWSAKWADGDYGSLTGSILRSVGGMDHATPEVERQLRGLFKNALPHDKNSGLAMACAATLHRLYKKYPEPQRGSGDEWFANAKDFLSVPIG
jgi:hypothetical protein